MAQSNSISIFVKSQVPDFWNRDGEELVGFIQTYYQWLEQFDNPIKVSRKLADYKDADLIPDKYFQFMRNEFMKSIPVTLVDDRLLLKNIVDFYRARGTEKAYNMLFRILYGDENVSYYYPGKDMLRASDGKWVIERSLKLRLVIPIDQFEDLVVIRGTTNGGTARKDKFISYVVNEVQTNELYINNIFGTFEINEGIINDDTGQQIGFVTDMVTYPGGWIGTDGFLSSNKYLQDNYFYQEYSYQIRSSHSLSEYESVATQLVHPAGTKLFGAVDMLATADLSKLQFSLLSNLENVGDVAKITISYELILPEQPNFGLTDDVAVRTWQTKLGTQDTRTADTIGFWANYPAFQAFGGMSFTLFSSYIILHSNVPSFFNIPDWTPIKIIDAANANTNFYFAQKVVNNSILVLSREYEFGLTSNLHYQTLLSDQTAAITEANDTLSSTTKIALKAAFAKTEANDTVSASSTISPPVAITATGNYFGFSTSPWSSASQSIGSVAADRVTALSVDLQNIGTTSTITGITCGGVAMTRRVINNASAVDSKVSIWEVASGTATALAAATTAVFAITVSTGNIGGVAQAYKITGSAVGGGSGSTTTTGTTSVTITVPGAGGALVACGQTNINAGSINNVTTDYNQAETTSNNERGIMGSTTTSGSLTSTYSGTGSSVRMVAATYKAP